MSQTQKNYFTSRLKTKISKALNILFFFSLFFLIGSWGNKNKKSELLITNHNLLQNSLPDPIYFPAFVMDKSQVSKYLLEGKGSKKIILRYIFKGMLADKTNMKVIAYWAVDQNQHGQDGGSIKAYVLEPDTSLNVHGDEIIPTQRYILGNNYMKISKIDKYLKDLVGGETNYDYLRFTPILPETSNNLSFRVQACKNDGTIVKQLHPKYLGDPGGIITNPSPPDPPGEL